MSAAEQHEELEFKDTKHPHLRVARGGKGPPEAPADNWLETLEIGTVFACRANATTVDWEMYFLVHKFLNIYLLKMETPDGKVWERRVDPKMFCKHYRVHEVIAHYPQVKEEAPEGDDDDSDRTDRPRDVVLDAPV